MNTDTRLSLLGVLAVLLFAAQGCSQGNLWEAYNTHGVEAYQQGNYAEAEKQMMAALQEAEQFGPEDPRLATSLNNLALLYNFQGKYEEAEPLYQRSLAIREKALSPDHPDVATSLNNLALLYFTQGKYTEAVPLYHRSLAIREKALGPDHPDVATSLDNYAFLLRKMGHADEAEKMEARAQSIYAKLSQENP